MIDVKVNTEALDQLIRRLEGTNGELSKVAAAMGEAILEDATERVPVDTGKLKESGRTESRRDGTAVIFGDERAPYAADLHENPSIEPTSGEKRFLRNAAMQGTKLLRIAAARLTRTISK